MGTIEDLRAESAKHATSALTDISTDALITKLYRDIAQLEINRAALATGRSKLASDREKLSRDMQQYCDNEAILAREQLELINERKNLSHILENFKAIMADQTKKVQDIML